MKFIPKIWYFLNDIVAIEFEHGYAVRAGLRPHWPTPKPHFIWRPF